MELVALGSAGWMPTDIRETSCYAIRRAGNLLLLDAGTGIRRLVTDPRLHAGVERIDIVLSHFHIDHLVGLTYLSGMRGSTEITVHGPGHWLYDQPTDGILARITSPPMQTITLAQAGVRVTDLSPDGFSWSDLPVTVRHQRRHTAPSVALRVSDELAYCTDTAYDPDNVSFVEGCRLLLHDAWHTQQHGDSGHSSAIEAARIASAAAVGRLGLIHIAPTADPAHLLATASRRFGASMLLADKDSFRLGPDSGGGQ